MKSPEEYEADAIEAISRSESLLTTFDGHPITAQLLNEGVCTQWSVVLPLPEDGKKWVIIEQTDHTFVFELVEAEDINDLS